LDPASVELFKEDKESIEFLKDAKVKQLLQTAVPLKDVKIEEFDAVFWVGGYASILSVEYPIAIAEVPIHSHGPMLDLAFDPTNAKLLETVRLRPVAQSFQLFSSPA